MQNQILYNLQEKKISKWATRPRKIEKNRQNHQYAPFWKPILAKMEKTYQNT